MKNASIAAVIFITTACLSFFAFNYVENSKYEYTPQSGRLDHIVLATHNIQKGMDQFEELTGVRPSYGGKHKSGYTQNAIVSLGDELYIEILAPQETEKAKQGMKHFEKYTQITPLTWAINTNDIQVTHNNLRSFGYKTSKITSGFRIKPNQDKLVWHQVNIKRGIPQKPGIIQWENMAVHPARGKDQSCSLHSMELNNNQPEDLKKLVEQLNIEGLNIKKAEKKSISFTLDCPKGLIRF